MKNQKTSTINQYVTKHGIKPLTPRECKLVNIFAKAMKIPYSKTEPTEKYPNGIHLYSEDFSSIVVKGLSELTAK
jgi:hypothetical protein